MVIEFLGLPGVGKTTKVRTLTMGKYINDFWFPYRIYFVVVGLGLNLQFLLPIFNMRRKQKAPLKPFIMLCERVGVMRTLYHKKWIFDECLLQLIWGCIYDIENYEKLENGIVYFLSRFPGFYIYHGCSKQKHIIRVHGRQKNQRFDQVIKISDKAMYRKGRSAMAYTLRLAKTSGWTRVTLESLKF